MSWLRYNASTKALEVSTNEGSTWTTIDVLLNTIGINHAPPTATGLRLRLTGNALVEGPAWATAGDIASIAVGGFQHGIANSYGVGLKLCTYKLGGSGTMGTNSADAVSIDETTLLTTFHGPVILETGVWDDLVVPATGVNITGHSSPMTVITSATDWVGCLKAANTGTPTCSMIYQLPHAYKLGTDVKPHIHWVKNDATSNTGTVTWEANFRHIPLNGVASAWTGFSAGSLTLDPGNTANKGAMTSWTLANSTYSFGISDLIVMVLQRNGGTSGDVALISGDIHLQKVRLGSLNEGSLT